MYLFVSLISAHKGAVAYVFFVRIMYIIFLIKLIIFKSIE